MGRSSCTVRSGYVIAFYNDAIIRQFIRRTRNISRKTTAEHRLRPGYRSTWGGVNALPTEYKPWIKFSKSFAYLLKSRTLNFHLLSHVDFNDLYNLPLSSIDRFALSVWRLRRFVEYLSNESLAIVSPDIYRDYPRSLGDMRQRIGI